ncbi:MAG: PilZ domain-containing protein [Nitrospirota bacterium]
MSESSAQPIVIHFKDGRIDRGLLASSLLTHETLQYRPRTIDGERRGDSRLPVLTDAKIDRLTVVRVTDVSARGAFVETLTPYPVGTVVTVSLRLGAEPIETAARIAFSDPGVGMGVEFIRLSTAERHRLDAGLHRLVNGGSTAVSGRRRAANRRTSPGPDARPRWDGRRQDRRQSNVSVMETAQPIPVDLETVKSIFFVESTVRPEVAEGGAALLDRQVTVEFRDGEMIQGTLGDFSPDTVGFFIALRLDERHAHTVYVVKSAVKSLQTVF